MSKAHKLTASRFLAGKSDPGPLTLLEASDEFLEEQVLERFRAAILEPGFEDFNYHKIRCLKSTRAGPLLDALAELPVMTEGRLLVLQNVELLSPDCAEAVAGEIAAGLGRGVHLVVSYVPGRRKLKSALVDLIAKQGMVLRCEMGAEERQRWAEERLKSVGVKAGPGAIAALLERVGDNSRSVASQLDRLALLVGKGQTVTRKEVESIVSVSSTVAMWKLTAAVGKKNLPEATSILDRVISQGEHPGTILSYLNAYLVGLVQVGGLYKRLGSPAEVARAIPRKKEFQVKKTLQELKTWGRRDLELAFEMLARADQRMKTGHAPRMVLQLLLLQLCSRRANARRR